MRVMWKVIVAAVLSATFVVGSATPASAQSAPALQAINSARDRSVTTLNGTPVGVCETRWESANRYHQTCRDLVTATLPLQGGLTYVAGNTYDFIYYDGTVYFRENAETRWDVTNDPTYSPDDTILSLVAGSLGLGAPNTGTVVGTATVAGVQTVQLQFWLNDLIDGGRVVADLFIDQNGLVRSYASSYRTDNLNYQTIVTLQDLNTPITIAAPDAQSVNWK